MFSHDASAILEVGYYVVIASILSDEPSLVV